MCRPSTRLVWCRHTWNKTLVNSSGYKTVGSSPFPPARNINYSCEALGSVRRHHHMTKLKWPTVVLPTTVLGIVLVGWWRAVCVLLYKRSHKSDVKNRVKRSLGNHYCQENSSIPFLWRGVSHGALFSMQNGITALQPSWFACLLGHHCSPFLSSLEFFLFILF